MKRSVLAAAMCASAVLAACGHLHGALGGQGSGSSVPSSTSVAVGVNPNQPGGSYPNGISPTWLSEKESLWGSAPASPFLLSPTMGGASYDNVGKPQNTLQVLDQELSMLEETGAQGITVDIGYDPWLSGDKSTIAKDDAVIDAIRSSGHQVVLKDASAERYRHNPLPWDQLAAAWVQRVRTIAERYHPDYYTVIKEPPWYAPMIAGLSRRDLSSAADKQVLNVSTWTSLLTQLIAAVKSVSPNTKVGIAVSADIYGAGPGNKLDLGLMKAATAVDGLDFLGFDIYTASAFVDTQRFLSQVGTGGKAVWINEAWSTTSGHATNPLQEHLDAQWASVLLGFARTIHAQGVSPFFTDFFASYQPLPRDSKGLLTYFQGLTPVFRAFQSYETACREKSPTTVLSAPC